MATSPVPDMAAPPGMCPGVAVLGGGGGGGDGEGDGSGGNGGQGGGGDGSGDGAGGDGKGAQGAPDYQRYPECGYASHPVDVVTGRSFTHPLVDLDLPGPLPLQFRRMYSSKMAKRDVGLGFGWGHTFGWEIGIERRRIRVWNEQGIAVDFPMIDVGSEIVGPWGWLLRRNFDGFTLDADDGVWRSFSPVDARGKQYRLVAIEDRNKNRIAIIYEDKQLREVVDSAGRRIRFRSTLQRRIASIEANNAHSQGQWISFARYEYDADGNLSRATDADGHCSTYSYDEDHQLTEDIDRVGLAFHFRYDQSHRCVESWGNYPNRVDPSLGNKPLPPYLQDQVTRTKGIHHAKLEYGPGNYSEVADATEVRRYFGNEHGTLDKRVEGGATTTASYDKNGHIVARIDPRGGTVTYLRDARGRLLALTDALGRTTTIERDQYGLVTRFTTPAGGVRTFSYDDRGNLVLVSNEVGAITAFRYDTRGLMIAQQDPDGHIVRFEYDAHGNLTSITHPDGAIFRFFHDALGRQLSRTDPLGATFRYSYTTRGDLVAVTNPQGGVTRYAYDGEGRIVEIISPAGRTTQMIWGGYNKICAMRDGNGHWTRVVYGPNGEPLELHNELGEIHRYDYTPAGMIREEITFDGTSTRYRHDASGDLIELRDARGKTTRFIRDLTGNVIARELPDGTTETIERDALNNIIRARNNATEIVIERDISGRIVRELQRVNGVAEEVLTTWNSNDERVERRTSRGVIIQRQHDHASGDDWLHLSPNVAIRSKFDALGREIERTLPGGARISSAFNILGGLERRTVYVPHQQRTSTQSEPSWLGPLERDHIIDHTYRYDIDGLLTEADDRVHGKAKFQHDAVGQLLAAIPHSMRGEIFRFDAAGNLHEVSRVGSITTEHGPGNRLLRQDDKTYLWNDLGQLTEKRVHAKGEPDRVTRYEWGSHGQLSAVDDSNCRVEFLYDIFLRRVQKRVSRRQHGLGASPVSDTRFIWDGNVLAQEIKQIFADSGDPVVEERSYCFEENSFVPLAQRDSRREGDNLHEGDWAYYVNGPSGAPERLVAADGTVLCDLQLSAWGRADFAPGTKTTTPLRFQGQFADDETGLHYNRFRYYDPETGRYLNHDPLGVDGGLNLYRYVEDPLGWIDPLGLAGRCTCTITLKKPVGGKKTFKGTSGGADDHHPSVQSALSKTAVPKNKQPPAHLKGGCGEPRALTNYLNAWEADNGKIKNHADLDKALNNIKSMDPFDNEKGNRKILCNYCQAFLPKLGGQKLLSKVKQQGALP